MKFRVSDAAKFRTQVFGGDSFLENWPELLTDGIEVEKIGEFYFVMCVGKPVSDSAFFSEEEMKLLHRVGTI